LVSALDPEFLKSVEQRAADRCMAIVETLMKRLIVDGETYGDIPLDSPDEFVAFYVDLEQRGVLRHLAVVSPKMAEQYERRFRRDAATVMGLN